MAPVKTNNTSWNLSPLFKSDTDQEIEKKRKLVKKKSYEFINKWKSRKEFLEKPEILAQALDEYEEWMRNYGCGGDEEYYFSLRSALDQNDPVIKAKVNSITDFSLKIANDIEFFALRIAKIPEKKQKKFLNYPKLKKYKHYLGRLFEESNHLLSEPEEKILNLKSTTSYANWIRMTSSFLVKEERKVIVDNKETIKNFSEINSLVSSTNKKTRDSAALALNDILEKHSEVAESELNSILEDKKTEDELRGFSRPDESRHISDDIESEVVDALVKNISKRFDLSKKYYKLKSKLMNIKKLKYHERNVPYGKIDKEYSFREGVELIYKVFNNLDPEFGKIFTDFLAGGQIDAFPKKGKTGGAFCASRLITQPTFVLLNYTNKLDDILAVAHEMGHAVNAELMKKNQNALNFAMPLSTAETASTFMEDFVLKEILDKADDELKLSIMMMKLNQDVSTIFRQVACYKFEHELHNKFREKFYLSKEEIGKIFQEHMQAYMGDYVEQSPGSGNWWIPWTHIRYFFYNYSYALGLLISKSMQSSVYENHKFIEKVKEFLSEGTSDSPKNILKRLDINISDKRFWDKGLNEVETLLTETEKLAKKSGKI
ncbi:M3 family oligoendopeptidase [Candidatus Woesearchaeota archaeon]|nr:M3 family oligoendopeptidase [Candidatus Woesearchaeota archaeon]